MNADGFASPEAATTWKDLAAHLPEFVAWIVQRHGGVPDGPITEDDYDRFKAEYEGGR